MGSFAGYYGQCQIPEEKKAELKERMLTLLTQGGMMDYDTVSMFGYKLALLKPPTYDEDEKVVVSCNYFEDDRWEGAGYNAKEGNFWSNKVGGSKFALVVCAAYVLLEFYSATRMIAEYNGVISNERSSIGWLNHLFNEEFTNKRADNLWDLYKILPEFTREPDLLCLQGGVDKVYGNIQTAIYMFVAQFDVYGEVINDIPDQTETGKRNIYSWIAAAWRKLQEIKERAGETAEEKLTQLKAILTTPLEEVRNVVLSEQCRSFVTAAKLLPYEITLKLIAVTFELEYWSLLEEMTPLIADKESAFGEGYDPTALKPVPAVPTEAFLKVSDEDRLLFWAPDGDAKISEETTAWFAELRKEFDEIMDRSGQLIEPKQFLPELMRTLHQACDDYRRIYFFEDQFNEFAVNGSDRRVQAAVILLRNLMERYKDEVEELEKAHWPYELRKPGRLTIKRYIALLANLELRQQVFGF